MSNDTKKGMGIHARRLLAYIVLTIVSFFCLFWFYVMFINATRSNGELQSGFTAIPSTHLLENWNNLVKGTLPIWSGMINSLIISACAAVLCTYFSTMTAYAIHAYEFKLKKYIYPFILMIMMIPTQVTALGFIKLVNGMHLMDSFLPLIIPSIAMSCLFVAVNAWNSWFDTYLYTSGKKNLHSLQYVLMSFLQASQQQSNSASNANVSI